METFLAPLARLAARDPELDGHVFWASEGSWPDAPAEALEAEEIAFYVEGLLIEGFRLTWQAIGTPEDGAEAILLYVSQDAAPPPPDYGPVLAGGSWPG